MRRLAEVLAGLPAGSGIPSGISPETPVTGVTSDSRAAGPGVIFVAVHGGTHDGHRFIATAIQQGALLAIGQDPEGPQDPGIPYLRVPDSRLALARLAASFHGNPSHELLMVGVTGTSGKTTTTYLVEAILAQAGRRVGVLGTVNFRFEGKILPSTHTTPGPVETQEILAQMRGAGCDAVVMETSSHALKQERVAFVEFDAAGFSNLSPEHLDFHPDMEDYFAAKQLLFTRLAQVAREAGKNPCAAVNLDDEYGRRLATELRKLPASRLITFGLDRSHRPELDGSSLAIGLDGISGSLERVDIHSRLLGRFNASNILCAVAIAQGLGIAPGDIGAGIAALKAVPGRLERVPNGKGIHVLVDYAHKSDALQKVLETLRKTLDDEGKGARLITVFGCGGDRDRAKRPVMGAIATRLSDQVIITSDNPRTENPDAIIAEITTGLAGARNFTVEPDRKRAIFAGIQAAREGDIVVIAGKGHEDYQIISDPKSPGTTQKIHFDDREVAAEALT